MDSAFEEEIKEKLSGLSLKDVVRFAWICAVRSLPFLGTMGHFAFWDEIRFNSQINLLFTLRALDTASAACAVSAHDIAEIIFDAGDAGANAVTYAAAVYATDVAAFAVQVRSDADATIRYSFCSAVVYIIRRAVSANGYAVVGSAFGLEGKAHADIPSSRKIQPVLLNDLETLKAGYRIFSSDITVYGEIWHNFQKALRDINCEYWGDWYEKLFAKGFLLDDENKAEIKLRLNAPEEILSQGAATVARYVMEQKKQGKI